MAIKDLSGKKFGRWTVIDFHESKNWTAWWNCVCDCGTRRSVRGVTLSHGSSTSCGCKTLDRLKTGDTNRTHGMTRSRTYDSWRNMKKRVLDPNHKDYHRYKKYQICERWLESFDNFLADMGVRPKNKTLDRVDNSKGYFKENCRWASPTTQSNNRSTNNILTYKGQKRTVTEWARHIGVKPCTVQKRIESGMPIEKILFPGNLRGAA